MRALPYVSSGRPSEHIGQPLPALRSSQSSSQVRLIAAKTLAFREPCYRNGPGDDVVAEDGNPHTHSGAATARPRSPVSPRGVAGAGGETLDRDREGPGVVHEMSVIDPCG